MTRTWALAGSFLQGGLWRLVLVFSRLTLALAFLLYWEGWFLPLQVQPVCWCLRAVLRWAPLQACPRCRPGSILHFSRLRPELRSKSNLIRKCLPSCRVTDRTRAQVPAMVRLAAQAVRICLRAMSAAPWVRPPLPLLQFQDHNCRLRFRATLPLRAERPGQPRFKPHPSGVNKPCLLKPKPQFLLHE